MFEVFTSSVGTIHVRGEVDMATVGQLDSVLAPAIREGGPITLDISKLEFMDSSAMHAIATGAKALGERGCIVIHGVDGNAAIRKLFELTQIGKVRNIHVIPCDVIVEGS